MQLGMIGFGRLGALIAKNLAKDFDLYVYDKVDYSNQVTALGATSVSLKEVCQCPIVIPFVPISEMQNILTQISPLLKKDSLIIDVCSVKSEPMRWMKEILPKEVSIIGTHPMFGPDSAKNTLFGHKIVMCNERADDSIFNEICLYLEGHGLKVIKADAHEHDKQIAHSLLLTHFLGRTLIDFGADHLDIDTKGYRRLMKILETVENDSWQLFLDMNKYNPYALETRNDFIASLKNIDNKVRE